MKKWTRVDTTEKLLELDKYLMDGNSPRYSMLAFDTETNGLLFYRNVVIGFSVAANKHEGFYIPFLDWEKEESSKKRKKIKKVERQVYEEGRFKDVWTGKTYEENVGPKEYRPQEFLVAYMRRWLTCTNLIMHNAPFDCNMVLYNLELDLSQFLLSDTFLESHFVDSSQSSGLKERYELYKKELGVDPYKEANIEKKELTESIIVNGGKNGQVWRGDAHYVAKYGAADTCKTIAIHEVNMDKIQRHFKPKQLELFFDKEIMPLCREVVIPMQFGGVYIDVSYFENLKMELIALINRFEDEAISGIGKENLEGFSIGASMEEAVSNKAFIERIIELEHLPYPVKITHKGKPNETRKKSLAKDAVKKAYQDNPHWLWGYILGEDTIKYSSEKQKQIKEELYREKLGRRYHFNLNSDPHIRWLLYEKLKNPEKGIPRTDSNLLSCKAEVLEEFYLNKYEWVQKLMTYRKLSDLLSNYIEKAVTLHNNGWLHMNMNQGGTAFGRFSCSGGFNLQTLPKVEALGNCSKCDSKKVEVKYEGSLLAHVKCTACGHYERNIICYSSVKKGFVAPPGYDIINADYASLEPRCFAYMSGDQGLKDIYIKDLDMYSKVYCDTEGAHDKYSPDPKAANFLKKANPALRDLVKPVVLGIPYGALGPQVARLMGFKKTVRDKYTGATKEVLDVERGDAWKEKYLRAYPDLQKYMDDCEYECFTYGYVETVLGRRRYFKYAPFIYQLITEYGISYKRFLNAKKYELNEEDNKLGLNSRGLQLFQEKFKVPWEIIRKKGYWAYVRALFKNDLDAAKNGKIQGLAAHITNKAMLDTARAFRQYRLDGYIALQVHDEIMGYVRKEQSDLGVELLKKGMEQNEFAKVVDLPMAADPIKCQTLKESK